MTNDDAKARSRAATKRWKAKNKDLIEQRRRERMKADPVYAEQARERTRESVRKWKAKYPERAKAAQQAWYEKNAQKQRDRAKARYYANPEPFKARSKASYHGNKEAHRAGRQVRERARKDAAYAAYGGYKCSCCGETTKAFLCIDHIDGCGTDLRKKQGSGAGLYCWLQRHGYPSGYRILCYNCNQGREFNGGVCPHVEMAKAS